MRKLKEVSLMIKNNLIRYLFVSLVVSIVACKPQEQKTVTNDFAESDLCKSIANPSATLALSPASPSVTSNSKDDIYYDMGCHRWVVDISVPNVKPEGDSLPRFSVVGVIDSASMPKNEADCKAFAQDMKVYKKTSSEFTFVAGGISVGVWVPQSANGLGQCVIRSKPDSWSTPGPVLTYEASGTPLSFVFGFDPPLNGTDIYRVTVGAKVGESWKQVYVRANYQKAK
jgi:hypothetical protein